MIMFTGLKNWFVKHSIEPQSFMIACLALLCLTSFVVVGIAAAWSSFFG